jgi:hypothetical protein
MSDQAWISADGTLRPGIYYGMSDADYQAINALRASTSVAKRKTTALPHAQPPP